MTREEAKRIFQSKNKHNSATIGITIDKIYDDFRSQTCESCAFLTHPNSYGYRCSNKESFVSGCVSKDFGCNKFEPKQ